MGLLKSANASRWQAAQDVARVAVRPRTQKGHGLAIRCAAGPGSGVPTHQNGQQKGFFTHGLRIRSTPGSARREVLRRTASKPVIEESMSSSDEDEDQEQEVASDNKEEDADGDSRQRLEAAYTLPSEGDEVADELQKQQHGTTDAFLGLLITLLGKLNRGGAASGPGGGDIYGQLAGEYDVDKLEKFFQERPWEVASRLLEFLRMALRVQAAWKAEDELPAEQRTRGDILRAAISSLGPVFVKCGQTLAQRGDLIGDESASALKSLQSSNQPFPDELGWQTILEDLGHDGPLSSDCPLRPGHPGKPLFAEFQAEHIASASLGQVYKALTHEGEEIALKVQRPNVLRQVALDMYVLRLGLVILRKVWGMTVDLKPIADEVGTGLFKELDYHLEAQNASDFNKAHAFLGYVRAPKFVPEYTGPKGTAKVLALEWINGKHIDKLEPDRAKLMVAMAVEASVAQLLRTGFVHVDPHEGNMMFTEDDELCYIDFGLMARVDPVNMEAFASGVCHMLAGKYYELSKDFMECGIVSKDDGYVKYTKPECPEPCSQEEFAAGLKKYMEGEEDGRTRFGALATGLGQMSFDFQLKTPPYIILLCRTFLTLEGIAAKVEPDFSIYTAALPFAVRRALSPETPRGKDALRSALLDDTGNFRFDYFSEILEQTESLSSGSMDEDDAPPVMAPSRSNAPQKGAKPQSGAETLTGLLGSVDGRPLRKVANEVNTLAMANTVTGPEGRVLRRQSSRALASAILSSMDSEDADAQQGLPPAAAVQRTLREKEQRRMQRALKVIGGNHMRNLATAGPMGWFAMVKLFFVMVRIFCGALLHIIQDDLSRRWKGVFGRKGKDTDQQAGGGKTGGAGSSGSSSGSPASSAAPAL